MASRKPTAKEKAARPAKKKTVVATSGGRKKVAQKKTAPKKPAGSKKAAPAKKSAGAGPKKTVQKKTVPSQSGARKDTAVQPVDRKKTRLREIKKELLQRKAAIIREAKQEIAKYISGENRQLVDTAIDEGDWAVVDISEDINLRRLDAHRKTMRDIDEVIRKIDEGSYGICEECGEEISEKRLRVIPTAALCINCQENKEQLEAVEREEIV